MKPTNRHLLVLVSLIALVLAAGCGKRNPGELPAAIGDTDPVVFEDAMPDDVYFQGFFATHVTAVTTDSVFAYGGDWALDGARSLKYNVPPQGSSLGLYTGGVLTSAGARDLAGYNALTFYARANQDLRLDVLGYGNDNSGTSLYEAGRGNVPIGRDWTFVIIPIPNSDRLRSERGMFTFAEAPDPEIPDGYDVWIDEIRWAQLGNIEVFRATMTSANKMIFVGASVQISGTRTVFLVDGGFVPVDHMPGYFDFTSSDPSVAEVDGSTIHVRGTGTATVNAKLKDVDVLGNVNITAYEPPAAAAPDPTLPAGDVISLFSDVYVDRPVPTWRTDWSQADYQEYAIAGNPAKLYSSLSYVGINFQDYRIDLTNMTHMHLDVYAPEGSVFRVKLVTPDGTVTPPETADLVLSPTSVPPFGPGDWVSLDIPLADFVVPAEWDWTQVGEIVLSTPNDQTATRLVLVDNVYFHK